MAGRIHGGGQVVGHRGKTGDPEREAQQVLACRRYRTAVSQTWSADVAFVEGDIAEHAVAIAEHRQLEAMRVVRSTAQARRRVKWQRLGGSSRIHAPGTFGFATLLLVPQREGSWHVVVWTVRTARGDTVTGEEASVKPDCETDDIDPRRIRSRTRLLDAAANLLSTGGVEAVTIDAVTKASEVARTTLYRHFSSSSHLLAATFERLLPHVTPPAPTSGTLRERLIELLSRQATLLNEAPLHVTTLAWLALGPSAVADSQHASGALRCRVVEQYRKPFDALLRSPDASAQLDEFNLELVLCQLVGPLVFARMTGVHTITHDDCTNIVDDFLKAPSRAPQIKTPSTTAANAS